MATAAPLMPKATAVWLLDNTALSFDQIAEFCKLHPLEVKAIADGEALKNRATFARVSSTRRTHTGLGPAIS